MPSRRCPNGEDCPRHKVSPHGTRARYVSRAHACRCQDCRDASNVYLRAYRRRPKPPKKAKPKPVGTDCTCLWAFASLYQRDPMCPALPHADTQPTTLALPAGWTS